jgi:hypothetical protein
MPCAMSRSSSIACPSWSRQRRDDALDELGVLLGRRVVDERGDGLAAALDEARRPAVGPARQLDRDAIGVDEALRVRVPVRPRELGVVQRPAQRGAQLRPHAATAVDYGMTDVPSWLALGLLAAVPFAFLFGLLRMRLARAAAGRLVIELGDAPERRGRRTGHRGEAGRRSGRRSRPPVSPRRPATPAARWGRRRARGRTPIHTLPTASPTVKGIDAFASLSAASGTAGPTAHMSPPKRPGHRLRATRPATTNAQLRTRIRTAVRAGASSCVLARTSHTARALARSAAARIGTREWNGHAPISRITRCGRHRPARR